MPWYYARVQILFLLCKSLCYTHADIISGDNHDTLSLYIMQIIKSDVTKNVTFVALTRTNVRLIPWAETASFRQVAF